MKILIIAMIALNIYAAPMYKYCKLEHSKANCRACCDIQNKKKIEKHYSYLKKISIKKCREYCERLVFLDQEKLGGMKLE